MEIISIDIVYAVPDAVLNTFRCIFISSSSQQPHQIGTVFVFILQLRKLSLSSRTQIQIQGHALDANVLGTMLYRFHSIIVAVVVKDIYSEYIVLVPTEC